MSTVPKARKVLFATALDSYESTDVEGVGTIHEDVNGNVFRWVQNGEATSITATAYGLGCYDGSDRTTVKKPTTAQLKNAAGFWQAAVPGQQYGWIQCKGKGYGLVRRSGAASSDTITSSAAMLSLYIGADGAEYVSQSNALGLYDHCFCPEALATLASTGVGDLTTTLTFNFKL